MLSKEEILRVLKANRGRIKGFGVRRIGVFGSLARRMEGEESDIDILVEFERSITTWS